MKKAITVSTTASLTVNTTVNTLANTTVITAKKVVVSNDLLSESENTLVQQ